MNTLTWGIVSISTTTTLSVLGLWALKSTAKSNELDKHQTLAGTTLSVIGTLFSVVLGFLVAVALHSYENARATVESEANRVADVFILSRGLPDTERKTVRGMCRQYCDAVVDEEWADMEKKETSKKAWRAYYTLWDQVLSITPGDSREADIHTSMLSSMEGLGERRRTRIANMSTRLSPALWVVAASGSLVIILITYILATEASLVPCLITALLAASLALNIFLLSIYSSPFSGFLKITPHGFKLDQELFKQDDSPASYIDLYANPAARSQSLDSSRARAREQSADRKMMPPGSQNRSAKNRSGTGRLLIKDLKIGP